MSSYGGAGRLTSTAFPTGVTEARAYTDADQLLSIAATRGGSMVTGCTVGSVWGEL